MFNLINEPDKVGWIGSNVEIDVCHISSKNLLYKKS